MLLAIFVFCFAVIPAFASDCTAPVQFYWVQGTTLNIPLNISFGENVAAIGDIDGDGKMDFAVGCPRASPYQDGPRGSVYVYSGGTGSFLYQINGNISGDYIGQAIAGVSDVNGDGNSDLIAGGFLPPRISFYSGPDGAPLYEVYLPVANFDLTSIAEIGDLNGDGRPDLVIGVPVAGAVFVYSVADDSILYQINGNSSDYFGKSVAGIGDVNDDGNADFVFGAPFFDASSGSYLSDFGAVYVYSGIDGTPLGRVDGTSQKDYLGWSASKVGDFDKDGKSDFIGGGPFLGWSGIPARPSYTKTYSSISEELLLTKSSAPMSNFGWSVKELSDVDGDGLRDFMVGAPGGFDLILGLGSVGAIFVYSGSDGSLIYKTETPLREWDSFGTSIADLGDLDGNGKADILIGAPEDSPGIRGTHPGSVYVFASKTVPKGDLNFDSTLTIADVANLLNVAFIDNSLALSPCTADLNCDGSFSAADIVLLLNRIFSQTPLPCS
ncbi:MAG: FG-GAP-like repeat-containing protein [candidate division Zixibacteria bacterium]|nr:FG-GAP-like repeat-containing protein [candidate division Zixibacteria bacterium]